MLDSSLVFCTLLGPEGPGRRAVSKDTVAPIRNSGPPPERATVCACKGTSDFGLVGF